jgi:transposase
MALIPWKMTKPMTEKEQFITLARTGRFTISELRKYYGISRKTGHKYLKRYEELGFPGLKDRSRRPAGSPWATTDHVEKLILLERRNHGIWGPKKIRDRLLKVHGVEQPPNESTKNRRGQQCFMQGNFI